MIPRPAAGVDRARRDEAVDAAFLACVRASLPYARDLIAGLVEDLEADDGEFAGNQVPPPDEAALGPPPLFPDAALPAAVTA